MRRRLRHLVVAVALGAAAAVIGTPGPVARAAGDRAVIVIGGGTAVAHFDGSASGITALTQVASVTTLGFSGTGTAVCAITFNGVTVGNPATPSECLIGPGGAYWQYWRKAPGASGWSYSSAGAGSTSVTDGAMEGWVYAAARTPPPSYSFCSVVDCSPPTTAPPATSPPVPTPSPGASGTGSGSTATPSPATPSTTGSSLASGSGSADPAAAPTTTTGGPPGTRAQALVAPPERDHGSPVGLAAAGAGVAGLVGTGLWIRRRRLRP